MGVSDHCPTKSFLKASGSVVVDRCRFRNLKFSNTLSTFNNTASAVLLSGNAALRNSLIENCSVNGLKGDGSCISTNLVPAVYASSDNARIDNCTFLCNTNMSAFGIAMGGKYANCLFYGNVSAGEVSAFSEDPASCSNCVFETGVTLPTTASGGFTVDDPGFRPGTVVPGGRLANKGIKLEWMSRGADCQDFYGNPRMVSKPDIGCAESDIRPGFIIITR